MLIKLELIKDLKPEILSKRNKNYEIQQVLTKSTIENNF